MLYEQGLIDPISSAAVYSASAVQTAFRHVQQGKHIGKIVVRLTIAPNGAVTACTLVSSSYGDADFERKVVERVKLINFGPKSGAPFTMDYPIQFIPQ